MFARLSLIIVVSVQICSRSAIHSTNSHGTYIQQITYIAVHHYFCSRRRVLTDKRKVITKRKHGIVYIATHIVRLQYVGKLRKDRFSAVVRESALKK